MSPSAPRRFVIAATVPFWTRTVRTGRPGMSIEEAANSEIYICATMDRNGNPTLGFTTIAPVSDGNHRATGIFMTDDGEMTLIDNRSRQRLNAAVAKLRDLLQTVTPREDGSYTDEYIEETRVGKLQISYYPQLDIDLAYDFLDQNGFTSDAFIDEEPDNPDAFSIIHNDEENEISVDDLEEWFNEHSTMFMWVPVEFYRTMLANLLEAWDFNRS